MPNSTRLNVLLDLDQTLISAEDWNEQDFKDNTKKAKKFKFHDMDGYYIVCERPHVQEFLDYAFDNFNVSIWTAASKDYAKFIMNNIILIKPGRKLDYFFWDKHCKISKKYGKNFSKNLKILWKKYDKGRGLKNYRKDNTLILDDYDDVWSNQKCNSIPAEAFEIIDKSSQNDDFLKELIPKLGDLYNKKGECLTCDFHK